MQESDHDVFAQVPECSSLRTSSVQLGIVGVAVCRDNRNSLPALSRDKNSCDQYSRLWYFGDRKATSVSYEICRFE